MVITRSEFFNTLNTLVPGEGAEGAKNVIDRRLYFERLNMDALPEMHDYSKDERLYEFFEFPPQKTIQETSNYLKKLFSRMGDNPNERKAMYWFVRRLSDQKLVGTFSLVNIEFNRKSVEWGYGVDPRLWGHGYPLEMMNIAKKYLFEDLKMNRVWGQTMAINQRTISSLLAAGCKQEGVLRDFYFKDGTFYDAWAYSIVAKDYFQKEILNNSQKIKTIDRDDVASILSKVILEEVTNYELEMEGYGSWDSVTHFEVVVAIQDFYNIKFNSEEIMNLRSVEMICRTLEKKNNE